MNRIDSNNKIDFNSINLNLVNVVLINQDKNFVSLFSSPFLLVTIKIWIKIISYFNTYYSLKQRFGFHQTEFCYRLFVFHLDSTFTMRKQFFQNSFIIQQHNFTRTLNDYCDDSNDDGIRMIDELWARIVKWKKERNLYITFATMAMFSSIESLILRKKKFIQRWYLRLQFVWCLSKRNILIQFVLMSAEIMMIETKQERKKVN